MMETPVHYEKVGPTSWVAYRGRQAIWETWEESLLLEWFKDQGITEYSFRPFTIVVCR